jgi:hypothetical protein
MFSYFIINNVVIEIQNMFEFGDLKVSNGNEKQCNYLSF